MSVAREVIVTVEDGSIGTQKLADDAVTTEKVADGAIGTAAINDDAVTAAKLAADSVTLAALDATMLKMTQRNGAKAPVRALKDNNVTLSGSAPKVVDGVTLQLGDRVLVIGQTTTNQNGIYQVSVLGTGANGTWVRDDDADENGDLYGGCAVYVQEGSTYGTKRYELQTAGVIHVDIDAQVWAVSGGGVSDGDKGEITVSGSGSVFTIDAGAVTLEKMADLATDHLIGRDTPGTGVPEVIGVGGGIEFTGSGGIQRSALTGDVTASAGSNSTTVAKITETSGPTSLTIGTILDGQYPKRSGSTLVSVAATAIVAAALALDLFGDGSDGTATITGGTTTLTRDMYYSDLTIDASGILDTAGFRVHVSGTLTWNGSIRCNGQAGGTGAAAGIGGGNQAGGAGTAPYVPGANGAAGRAGTGNGTSSVARANNWIRLRNGTNVAGNGGASGGGNAGGTSGACTPPAADEGRENADTWETGQIRGTTTGGIRLTPGQGGSSGGVTGTANSGSGGGGGGIVGVFARRIAGTGGTAQATGGSGGAANNPGGGNAGGGGGGTGGVVIVRYGELVSGAALPTVDVSGGAGGAGAGTGAAGTAGTAGFSSVRCIVAA